MDAARVKVKAVVKAEAIVLSAVSAAMDIVVRVARAAAKVGVTASKVRPETVESRAATTTGASALKVSRGASAGMAVGTATARRPWQKEHRPRP